MYFITKGRVFFVNEDYIPFKTMILGSYFGEIEIIYKTKRSQTTVAAEDSDLLTLAKQIYENVIVKEYSEIHEEIKFIANIRNEKNKESEKFLNQTLVANKERINKSNFILGNLDETINYNYNYLVNVSSSIRRTRKEIENSNILNYNKDRSKSCGILIMKNTDFSSKSHKEQTNSDINNILKDKSNYIENNEKENDKSIINKLLFKMTKEGFNMYKFICEKSFTNLLKYRNIFEENNINSNNVLNLNNNIESNNSRQTLQLYNKNKSSNITINISYEDDKSINNKNLNNEITKEIDAAKDSKSELPYKNKLAFYNKLIIANKVNVENRRPSYVLNEIMKNRIEEYNREENNKIIEESFSDEESLSSYIKAKSFVSKKSGLSYASKKSFKKTFNKKKTAVNAFKNNKIFKLSNVNNENINNKSNKIKNISEIYLNSSKFNKQKTLNSFKNNKQINM